ncbi:MAG: DUF4870 domain-containing protein [Flavobacterium sp.]
MINQNEKNTAVALHLSALAKFLIPFAGIIIPMIIWQNKKQESEYIDQNGKSVLNFNLSVLLYGIIIGIIGAIFFIDAIVEVVKMSATDIDFIPVNLITIAIVLSIIAAFWCIIEFILIIIGSLKAGNGEVFHYPLSIPFLK